MAEVKPLALDRTVPPRGMAPSGDDEVEGEAPETLSFPVCPPKGVKDVAKIRF